MNPRWRLIFLEVANQDGASPLAYGTLKQESASVTPFRDPWLLNGGPLNLGLGPGPRTLGLGTGVWQDFDESV